VKENLYPNIILSYVAGFYPIVFDHEFLAYGQNTQPDPGELVEIHPYLTNFGLQSGNPLQVELVPRQTFATMNANQVTIPAMQPFDTLLAANFWQFQIDYNTPIGTELLFDILLYENGNLIGTDSLSMTIGTFEIAFSDSAENGMSNWTTGGNGGSWTTVSSTSHSPSHSFTESATGNYSNYADVWMHSNFIDLTNAATAQLKFWTKWDIEADWDFALVEISTNGGVSWSHVIGQFMTAASGIGVQTPGLYGYDGRQDNWVEEKIDLSSYCGQNIMVRFRLITDSGVTEDGWYLDDVAVRTLPHQTNIPPFVESVNNLGYQVYNGAPYPVDAVVLDDQGINQVSLFYSTDNGTTFQEILMSGLDSLYQASIPPLSPGMSVLYYVQAWDAAGAFAYFPYKAPYQMLNLNITGSGPVLIVEPISFSFPVAQLSSGIQTLKIINPDTGLVNFSITDSTVQMGITNSFNNNYSLETIELIHFLRKQILSNLRLPSNYQPAEFIQSGTIEHTNAIVITDSSGDAGTPGMDILDVDFSETLLNYTIMINYNGSPDTNSITVVSFDRDQNFGTGAYPAPAGYGLGNHDIGSEYDIVFDYGNFIGDSLGLLPSVYVLDVSSGSISIIGLPLPFQVAGNSVSANLPKFLFNIFDNMMNISATALPLAVFADPDFAPDFGHGNLGGELGSSWVTQLDANGNSTYPFTGTLQPGDSVLIDVKVSASYPLGIYQAMIKIDNNGPVSPVEVPLTLTIDIPGIPQIGLDPTQIEDTLQAGTGIHTELLTISNTGSGRLYIIVTDSIFNGQDWLSYNPTFALIEPGAQTSLSVEIDKTNLITNTLYQAELLISSTDPLQPELTIPVNIFIGSTSSIHQNTAIPKELALHANYPNPFNPTTTLSFDLPRSTSVTLEVYNLLGQRIKTIVSGYLNAGSYRFIWDGTADTGHSISAGIYFYQLKTDEATLIKKMILTK
jgi:hypothetical protein